MEKSECETNKQIRSAAAVLQPFYRSINVESISCPHKLWEETEKIRMVIIGSRNGVVHRVIL